MKLTVENNDAQEGEQLSEQLESELNPESSSSTTACWSSCGTEPGEARCSGQGENFKGDKRSVEYSFTVAACSISAMQHPTTGCSETERRFLCTMLSSKNKECTAELVKKLKPGQQCYTKCGDPHCPEGDFNEPSPTEDYKYLDCEGGAYRTRCAVRKHEQTIEFNPVAVPMTVPVE
ncbi:uncharacterized protein LOC113147004 [Cyclospora cayetanensis]|uniref:Uncharacterized protein LOC113147004 n=1 Tax=Cyclospora cayetanensis TaxID=88456 RepID=A0A6P6RVE8_9EIME|nr:uncharacterized protein LOC113147004 [Cyclospora cayetanensis]